MAMVRHYGRAMRGRGRGGIIFIGPLAGYMGAVRENTYAAAKAFRPDLRRGPVAGDALARLEVLDVVLGATRTQCGAALATKPCGK